LQVEAKNGKKYLPTVKFIAAWKLGLSGALFTKVKLSIKRYNSNFVQIALNNNCNTKSPITCIATPDTWCGTFDMCDKCFTKYTKCWSVMLPIVLQYHLPY
jgi:hypothetical protein